MRLKGWRYGVFVGSFFGLIGILCYSTMIRPMMNPEPYKKIRQQISNRESSN